MRTKSKRFAFVPIISFNIETFVLSFRYPFPQQAVWTCTEYPFPSPAVWPWRVYPFLQPAVWTCRVYPFPSPAVWPCRVYPFPFLQPAVWTRRAYSFQSPAVWTCKVYFGRKSNCFAFFQIMSGPKQNVFAFVQIISGPNQKLLLWSISFWIKQKRSTLPKTISRPNQIALICPRIFGPLTEMICLWYKFFGTKSKPFASNY